jgi:cyanophycin synthetase
MIAHIMTTAGKQVGMTTTDGMSINGTQIAVGDLAGPNSARKVLCNPAVDYAVLETAMGGIWRDGLGFPQCDVGVVTNVAADHLGRVGFNTVADMAKLKAVVPRAVTPKGASVLNADNEWTVAMAEVAGGEVIFFSLEEHTPVIQEHVRQGGRAVVLRTTEDGEQVTLLAGEAETPILLAEEIPATFGGRIRVNIANALAATAAAIAQEVPLETIRKALRSFSTSVAQTPGRFNLLEVDGRQVVIDYVHNVHGMEAMAEFVQRMGAPHSVAAIEMSGYSRDEDITAFGQRAAQIFDELVIRDPLPKYRRGRKPGEVPNLLHAAALAGGLSPDKISLVDDEREAADVAIAKAGPDGLVVLEVANDAAAIWNYLTQRQQAETTG